MVLISFLNVLTSIFLFAAMRFNLQFDSKESCAEKTVVSSTPSLCHNTTWRSLIHVGFDYWGIKEAENGHKACKKVETFSLNWKSFLSKKQALKRTIFALRRKKYHTQKLKSIGGCYK